MKDYWTHGPGCSCPAGPHFPENEVLAARARVAAKRAARLTTWRCAACGLIPGYHNQEPRYFGAEPGIPTQSVAQRERDCPGYEGREMSLSYARALRGRPFCPSCRAQGFEPRMGSTVLGKKFQGCEFCVETP